MRLRRKPKFTHPCPACDARGYVAPHGGHHVVAGARIPPRAQRPPEPAPASGAVSPDLTDVEWCGYLLSGEEFHILGTRARAIIEWPDGRPFGWTEEQLREYGRKIGRGR